MKQLSEAEKQIIIVKMVEQLKYFLRDNNYDSEMQAIADCTTNLLQISDEIGRDKCCFGIFGDTYFNYKELLGIINVLKDIA